MKKIIIGVSILIFTLTLVGIYIYKPFVNRDKLFYQIFDEGFTVSTNGQTQPKPINETYKQNTEKYSNKFEVVITNLNPFNPVLTYVQDSKKDDKNITYDILYLKRNLTNFSFEIESRIISKSKNKSFQEAVEIARKYDLTKENPDPANITVYPAPTKEEVEREKKNETIKSNPTRKAREDICNNLIAPLSELTNKAGGTTTPEITTKTKELNDCFAQLEKDFPTEPDPKFPNI